MDEQLKTQMAESAGKLLQWAEATSKDADALVREQAPQVAREIVALQTWQSAALILYALFGVLIAIGFARWVWSNTESWDGELQFPTRLITAIGSITAFGLAAISIPINGCYLIEAVAAPRVVILHELQKLL